MARKLLVQYTSICCTEALVQYLKFAREAFDERNQSAREHELQTGHQIVLCCHHEHAAGGYQTATILKVFINTVHICTCRRLSASFNNDYVQVLFIVCNL